MWNLSPWEPLPDSKTERNGWIEVATRSRATSYNCEGNPNGIGPSDLEDGAELGLRIVQEEGSLRGDAWVSGV